MKVVLVESPAKAKTINKYLGSDYNVMATVGHIRSLPNKDGVRPDEDFAMSWELIDRANKFVKQIKDASGLPVIKAVGLEVREDLTKVNHFAKVADQILIDAKPDFHSYVLYCNKNDKRYLYK